MSGLQPIITEVDDQWVLYVRHNGPYEEVSEKAWGSLTKFAEDKKINLLKERFFGISLDDPETTEKDKLRYDACMTAPDNIEFEGKINRRILKGGKCAVFTHHGPYKDLGSKFSQIFQEWYPNNHAKVMDLKDNPCICEYMNMSTEGINSTDNLTIKIYIPLKV